MADRLRSLLNSDYDVELVRDGMELVAAASRQMAEVIISDVIMPGLGGIAETGQVLAFNQTPASYWCLSPLRR